jgi:hypothetical protein
MRLHPLVLPFGQSGASGDRGFVRRGSNSCPFHRVAAALARALSAADILLSDHMP